MVTKYFSCFWCSSERCRCQLFAGNPRRYTGIYRLSYLQQQREKYTIQVALPTPSQRVRSRSRKCLSRAVHLALLIVSATISQLYQSQPVYFGFQEDHIIRIRRPRGSTQLLVHFIFHFLLYVLGYQILQDIYQSIRLSTSIALSTFYKYSIVIQREEDIICKTTTNPMWVVRKILHCMLRTSLLKSALCTSKCPVIIHVLCNG